MHSKVAFKCAMLKIVNTICEIRDVCLSFCLQKLLGSLLNAHVSPRSAPRGAEPIPKCRSCVPLRP